MSHWLPSLVAPLLVLILSSFLIFRLRLFAMKDVGGRYAFLFGAILALLATGWGAVEMLPDYGGWFVAAAYGVIDAIQASILAVALILVTVGLALYADYWQTRREEIESREDKLSILENLQSDARQPYQLMDLLTISLREVMYHLPDTAGAIFMLNRSRRQFVMAASSALTKQETAQLEYYPFGRNTVSQAIELGDPILASSFEFIDREGKPSESRFQSFLVLPLLSGMEKVGALLLFSEEPKSLGRAEIRYLGPVAEWLAEKIRTTRLSRQLSLSQSEVDKLQEQSTALIGRLSTAIAALSLPNALEEFCLRLTGVFGAESVHLVGLRYGSLQIHGGSEPLTDLSESYRTALLDAVDRDKPLIINQESTGESGRSQIVLSSLVVPLTASEHHDVLLFRKGSSAFDIQDRDLRNLELYTHLARVGLSQAESRELNIARRKGIEVILELLKLDRSIASFNEEPGLLMRRVVEALPFTTTAVALGFDDEGNVSVVSSTGVEQSLLDEIRISPGEGLIGRVAESGACTFVFGRKQAMAALEEYDSTNRSSLDRMIGERGAPSLLAACPVTDMKKTAGVLFLMVFGMDESQVDEWKRLLTLATGLYSLRLAVSRIQAQPETPTRETMSLPGTIINQLNNHLSAMVGKAELALQSPELGSEVRQHMMQVMSEAEQAAAFVRENLESSDVEDITDMGSSLSKVVEKILGESHISGDLYMAGGRPREIRLRLSAEQDVDIDAEAVSQLIASALDRFGAQATDDDILTVATYHREGGVYLDISRHRKNFPPVDEVANFGRYENAGEALQHRPSDVFLRHVANEPVFYAVERESDRPAFLSFRFPQRGLGGARPATSPSRVRLLAIDDHAVILDLISAMGQSLGYDVQTALLGSDGVRLAHRGAFDIVLTDLALPDISGLEVARQIRDFAPDVPIILVTGWEATLDRSQLSAVGIHKVLYKPFRIEQLTDIVRSAVSGTA